MPQVIFWQHLQLAELQISFLSDYEHLIHSISLEFIFARLAIQVVGTTVALEIFSFLQP